ncbi:MULTISPECIES: ABC transporter permease [Roseivirga]|jgi:putative ABC transport system permease protein|uniref:ABC transporter permease n=1 Tax=Roseivirga TaxID=290180 RepID=UPI00257D45B4|nr:MULTISPECIES: ABC transporter permease [Roseivirga]|tara:strand:+ start:762 stop:3176 length:2415 start_codon:yes stop_codon:yes gene_type:complete
MLYNYIKTAFRSIWKDKFFSVLNISGLAIGIACCMLIVTYVQYELSYDRHFPNHENIYRVVIEGSFNGRDFTGSQSPAPTGATFRDQIPGVEERLRLRNTGNWIVKYNDKVFNENRFVFADETFFEVFRVPLLKGVPGEVLTKKNHLAMSATTARKYFGDEDPIGKTVRLDNDSDWVVAGVYEDIPSNSHFRFNVILSFITRESDYNNQQWLNQNYDTYLVMQPNANVEQVQKQMNEIAIEKMGAEFKQYLDMTFEQFEAAGNRFHYFLQPIADIHLLSDGYGGFEPESDITYVYIFSAIAVFILVIACINFMNLSTARSANRAKEVGVRKVLGSVKGQLVTQFISESVLITFISGLIGLGLAVLLLPFFNNFAGREMSLDFVANLPLVFAGSVVVGFLAGLYPAFFLSAFSPVKVLKGNLSMGMKSGGLRKALVTFQFFISILLIIGTFSILNQLQYIQNKKLGFEKEKVLLVHNTYLLGDGVEAYKNELLANANVEAVSSTWYLPTSSNRSSTVFFPDGIIDQDRGQVSQNWYVDHNYQKVFGLELVKGRFFDRDIPTDSTAMVINEKAAEIYGIKDLENAVIGDFNDDGSALDRYKVIGIVKDFHFESLKTEIGPLVMRLNGQNGYLGVRLNAGNFQQVISDARSAWDQMATDQPFEYSFLDDRFGNMYETESRLGDIFTSFAVLAVLIACLGLFGLAAFTAQQKTKEVGIRKVLGATLPQLMYLMSKEVTVLILISFVVASAVGWYGVDLWMQSFAYRPPISVSVFLLAGACALVIALLTMSYQSIKVATGNPVRALRNE